MYTTVCKIGAHVAGADLQPNILMPLPPHALDLVCGPHLGEMLIILLMSYLL